MKFVIQILAYILAALVSVVVLAGIVLIPLFAVLFFRSLYKRQLNSAERAVCGMGVIAILAMGWIFLDCNQGRVFTAISGSCMGDGTGWNATIGLVATLIFGPLVGWLISIQRRPAI